MTLLSTLLLAGLSPLLSALIWIVVVALIFYVLWWFIGYVGLPAPFDKVVKVILALIAVIVVINFLLQILGNPF